MKIRLSLIAGIAAAVLLGPGWALANGDGNGIQGSPHDFTDNVVAGATATAGAGIENDDGNAAAWNNKRKEICRVCHVPHDHGAVRYGNRGILWNHQVTTKTDWVMYGDGVADEGDFISWLNGVQEAEPVGVSKLCLGCHDGVGALNQYDGKDWNEPKYGGGTKYVMSDYDGGFVVGGTGASLSNNHPISITYNFADDPGLINPASATMASGETVLSLLDNGRVECGTCHDVHNQDSVGGTHLLRTATKGAPGSGAGASALCLVCHDK